MCCNDGHFWLGMRCPTNNSAPCIMPACLQVRIVRIFNTYGPRMALDDGRVVSNFVSQVGGVRQRALRKQRGAVCCAGLHFRRCGLAGCDALAPGRTPCLALLCKPDSCSALCSALCPPALRRRRCCRR
jgi:hypothetical protein